MPGTGRDLGEYFTKHLLPTRDGRPAPPRPAEKQAALPRPSLLPTPYGRLFISLGTTKKNFQVDIQFRAHLHGNWLLSNSTCFYNLLHHPFLLDMDNFIRNDNDLFCFRDGLPSIHLKCDLFSFQMLFTSFRIIFTFLLHFLALPYPLVSIFIKAS